MSVDLDDVEKVPAQRNRRTRAKASEWYVRALNLTTGVEFPNLNLF